MKKYFFIKLFAVIAFLIISYFICDLSKYYFPTTTYGKNETRMVIDQYDVTKNLPDVAIVEDNHVFLSFNTIKKYFDKYIYFDEKYQTVILTNDTNVMKLKIDDNIISVNGEKTQIDYPATKSGDIIYLPVGDLAEILDIDINYDEKIIVSTQNVNYQTVKMPSKGKVKLFKKDLSGIVDKWNPEDVIFVYPSGENEEFVKVRTANGSLGYVRNEIIQQGTLINTYVAKSKDIDDSKKINLTWEYAENFTPDRSIESKIDGLNVLSPTWIYMKNGSGEVKNTIDSNYIAWAKQVGYELWPTVKNDSMGLDGTHELVTDMYARDSFINSVVSLANTYHFSGINIDFEYMKKDDSDAFSEFVREFSAELRRNGVVVSIDVTVPDGSENWSLCYDRKAIGNAVDYVILMAYDQYGKNQDGPVASLSWVDANIHKMLEQENIPKEKLILGVPFYSKRIKYKESTSGEEIIKENVSGSTLYMKGAKNHLSAYKDYATWNELMGQYYVEVRNGSSVDKAWIEDEKALEEKVKLVDKYQLAGVASWRRGFETDDVWSIIKQNVEGL